MAAKKPTEPKVEFEREYIVPLRKEWLKVPEYKRNEGVSRTLMKKIGRKKAHKMVMGGASFIKWQQEIEVVI